MNFLMGRRNLERKIATMTSFVFDIALARQGVYLSKDRLGVLITFDYAQLPLKPREKRAQMIMALRCFSWLRLRNIAKTEALIQAKRRAEPKDLYVWFYAVSDKGLGGPTARELLHDLFDLSQEKNAAIIAETSMPRNMVIYKRYGFECYAQQNFDRFPVFYMRRPPVQKD